MARPAVDRDKVRVVLQRLDQDDLRDLAGAALDLLPDAQVATWLQHHVRADELRPDPPTRGALLTTVRAFHAASLGGAHYDSFNVNSKNHTQQSPGTRAWIAECERLVQRCVAAARKGKHREAREAFELIFDLLHRLDQGEDIVFFADEGGAWQVGIEWRETLPGYFACLAATATANEFAAAVRSVVDEHASHDRSRHIGEAKRLASREQRAALERAPARARR